MLKDKLKSIWSRYSITIVMVPSLVAIHYGWNQMQYNRSLVTEQEQIDLPVVTFAKYFWRRIQGETDKPDATKATLISTSTTTAK